MLDLERPVGQVVHQTLDIAEATHQTYTAAVEEVGLLDIVGLAGLVETTTAQTAQHLETPEAMALEAVVEAVAAVLDKTLAQRISSDTTHPTVGMAVALG